MWDLPGPGLEPVSPALAGGFLTPAPPGKSLTFYILSVFDLLETSTASLENCSYMSCLVCRKKDGLVESYKSE